MLLPTGAETSRFPLATHAVSFRDAEAWKLWRSGEAVDGIAEDKTAIGGTLAVAIAGLGWRSASEMWQERMGLLAPQVSTGQFEVGHIMEPVLRRRLARAVRGVQEGPVCVVGPESWMRGSLDDVLRLARGRRRAWAEIKVVLLGQREEWGEDEASLRAVLQGLWYGACTGLTEGYIGAGFIEAYDMPPFEARAAAERAELRVYHIRSTEEPWAALQQRLVARCRRWRDQHLIAGLPPDQEAAVAVSLHASARERVEQRDATDEEQELLRGILLRQQNRDGLSIEITDLRQRLVLAMGSTRKIVSPLASAIITNPTTPDGTPFLIVRPT